MAPSPGPLGEYLRARRDAQRPADVGLPPGRRRRVAGLRREEVAGLAGISTEYLIRLEQGRDRHPSDEVLGALADALRLEPDERAHLVRLAGRAPTPTGAELDGELDPSVQALIDSWPLTPAYVHGASQSVVAANRLAVAVCPAFAPGRQPIRELFLAPAMRTFYRDWDTVAHKAVALLRAELAHHDRDSRLRAVVDELRAADDDFAALWAANDVRRASIGTTRLLHPAVGALDLRYHKFAVLGGEGQMLVTYHAEGGSTTEHRLRLLADDAAGPASNADPLLGTPQRVRTEP